MILVAEYNTGKIRDYLEKSKNKVNKLNFKFILYIQEENQIANDLIKVLEQLCVKFSKPIFELRKVDEEWD